MSVNIAARHFQCEDFFDRLNTLLAQHDDVPPHLLEIEIVESAALGDIAEVTKVIAACQGLGVRFSLDDFGTGYSSLERLRKLPIDTLKIDRSFVTPLREGDDVMVRSIIHLGRELGMKIIAEGVEEKIERDQINGAGMQPDAPPPS